MTITNISNLISEGDNGYVDLSTATFSTTSITDGCITVINCDSPRIKPSKELLSAIGNPERIEVLFTDKNVIFIPARNEDCGIKLGKGNVLYNSNIARRIQKLAGIESKPGSTKVGKFHVQKFNEDTLAAVVSFDSSKEVE